MKYLRRASCWLALASLCGSLMLAEAACRAYKLVPMYAVHQPYSDGVAIRLDPRILFTVIATVSRPDINHQGCRDYEFGPRRPGRSRLLFLGDSFVMGLNVASSETIPKQLEARLRDWEVFNMGVLCYGPDQSLVQLLDTGLPLQPDGVVLAIFPGNDFEDLWKNQLFALDPQGRVAYNWHNPVAQVWPWLRLEIVLRRAISHHNLDPGVESRLLSLLLDDRVVALKPETPDGRTRVSLMRGVLRQFRDTLAAARVRFWVVVIPRYECIYAGAPPVNEDAVVRVCRDEGLACLDLRDAFQLYAQAHSSPVLYDPRDRHLSPPGTSLAARCVEDFLHLEGRH